MGGCLRLFVKEEAIKSLLLEEDGRLNPLSRGEREVGFLFFVKGKMLKSSLLYGHARDRIIFKGERVFS